MPEHSRHCPFLNRADGRCARHLSLDQLGHALAHCFGAYKACPTYLELLAERRVRQANMRASRPWAAADRLCPASVAAAGDTTRAPRVVQVTIAARHAMPAARRAAVPAPLGV